MTLKAAADRATAQVAAVDQAGTTGYYFAMTTPSGGTISSWPVHSHVLRVHRTAQVLTIGAAPANATELWVICHGYGELARDFIGRFASIASDTRLVAAPEALNRFYLDSRQHERVGASWMTREHRDADIADNCAYLDAVLEDIGRAMARPFALTVLGFSQGVATAMRWVAMGSASPRRVVLWGAECPHDIELAALQRKLPALEIDIVSGAGDGLVSHAAVVSSGDRLAAAGLRCTVHTFDGGHRLDDAVLRRLASRSGEG